MVDSFLEVFQKFFCFNFGIVKEMVFDLEWIMVRFWLYFILEVQDDNDELFGVKVEYGIEFYFKVENLSDFMREDGDGVLQFDVVMGVILLGIVFFIVRGIIFECICGIFFDGVILFVVDFFKVLEVD